MPNNGLLLVAGVAVALMCSAFGFTPFTLKHNAKRFTTFLPVKNGGGGKDERDPNNWDTQTSPFVAAKYSARDDVSDDQIKSVLQQNSIVTLDDLRENVLCMAPFMEKKKFSDFAETVIDGCKRPRKTIEETLGGESAYDDECVLPESLDSYSENAVSVSMTDLKFVPLVEKPRKIRFNLVLGSSGTGKSLFALKRLPILLFGEGKKAFFNVLFQAKDAVGMISGNTILSFPEGVASMVREMITEKLAEEGWTDVKVINLRLHVIIDEAGDKDAANFIDTAPKIREIVSVIRKKLLPLKFTGGIYVTLVGTGLDKITSKIKSVGEANKFRMQPWNLKNFEAFVEASDHPAKSLVLQIVHEFPILQDLVTNARCAFHLVDSMNQFLLQRNRLRQFVNVLVSAVADRYVGSNGLRELKKSSDKWEVARSVFKELDKATSHPGEAFFPEYEDLLELGLAPVAACLLDVHVESKNDKLAFVKNGGRYATSMSPALAIVTANLLNTNAELSWTWEGFESIVMLSELKRMVAKSLSIPNHLDRLVIELQSPAPSSNTSFSFPLVDDATVILNGPRASYADVIAPYRLVQAKFSKDEATPVYLDIKVELDKMGLTNSSDHWIQQNLTKTLYAMWSAKRPIPEATKSEAIPWTEKGYRYECYPMNTLNTRQLFEERATISGTLSRETLFVIEGGGISGQDLKDEFDKNRPVTAVFATNCEPFKLKNTRITIGRKDVDWEGKVKVKKLPPNLFLKENVDVRFLFF